MFVLRANLEPEDEDEELRVGTRVGLTAGGSVKLHLWTGSELC